MSFFEDLFEDPATLGMLATVATGGIAAPAAIGATGLLAGASEYLKPIGQAMGAANQVKGLLGSDQAPVQGQPVQVGQGGGGALNSLYQQIEQGDMQRMQAEREKRMRQQQNMYGGA